MEELEVIKTAKRYRFFQFSGFCDGHLAGQVTLNGAVMHALSGEPGSVATAAAQEALKYGRNVIRVEVTRVAKPQDPTFTYSILAVDGTEEGFDSDKVVEFQGDLSGVNAFPWIREYGFTLDGESFAALKAGTSRSGD